MDMNDDNVIHHWIDDEEKYAQHEKYRIFLQYVEYDKKENCLVSNIKNDNSAIFDYLMSKNFKIKKQWIFNKDLVCTDPKEIEYYLKMTECID